MFTKFTVEQLISKVGQFWQCLPLHTWCTKISELHVWNFLRKIKHSWENSILAIALCGAVSPYKHCIRQLQCW